MPPAQHGHFITLEGGEGAGKSTLAKGLKDKLEAAGVPVVLTREPGGTKRAEQIRDILLSGVAAQLGAFTETLLFAAARDDHLKQVIRPALAQGKFVICDRFMDSTRAYQGYVGGVEMELIDRLEAVVVGETIPEITFIIDVPPEKGLSRAKLRSGRADRFESETLNFHRRLRAAYLDIAQRNPKRCIVLDGELSPEALLERAWDALAARLSFAQR